MTRLHDWPEALANYIESRRNEPFQYGVNDCCQFAAGAVTAITGENPAIRWQYRNEVGAMRLIIEAGGIGALVTQAVGEAVHPSQAGRGDVVLAEFSEGPTLGVCIGRECVFVSSRGMLFMPRTVATAAWKI
jgi:hypothetical protein